MSDWQKTILAGLNEPQAKAVCTTNGPLLILAGAGSGKTRTIIHRLAYLIHVEKVPARNILMVTFTNKATEEMRQRAYETAGPVSAESTIRTYHSLGLMLLRQFHEHLNYPASFTIWDDGDQQSALKKILVNRMKKDLKKNEIRYLANSINSFKNLMISPENLDHEVDLDDYNFGEFLQALYFNYEKVKSDSMAFDFGDLLYRTVRLLETNNEVKDALQRKYRYLMVDEYQDTNFAQYRLVQILSSKEKNLCVVGDDDQAIYGWRGADVSNILNFNSDFPEAQVIKLEENYRSTKLILEVANKVIENNIDRMQKTLWTSIIEGEKPRVLHAEDDRGEASSVAGIISALQSRVDLNDIAILYRTNAQSRQIEEALLQAEIPYKVFGGVSFFERKEIKDMLAYLRFLANPFDETSFFRLINTPARGIGEKSLDKIYAYRIENSEGSYLDLMANVKEAGLSGKSVKLLEDLAGWMSSLARRASKNIDLGLLFEEVLEKSGLRAEYEEEDRLLGSNRIENLQELKNSMLAFQQQNTTAGLDTYLQEISLFTAGTGEQQEAVHVNLMTVHNAKGLEYDTVFLTGLDEDTFPHYLAKQNNELEEERRLFYVAVTRAKNRLYLLRAARRMGVNRTYGSTVPSRFLNEIPTEMLEVSAAAAGSMSRESYRTRTPIPAAKRAVPNIVIPQENSQSGFKSGDKVKHITFGWGRVLKIEGTGDSTKIHIFFDDGKTRKFILKFTKLEKK